MKTNIILLSAVTALIFTACGNGSSNETKHTIDTKEKLGKHLFFDESLSKTRNTSCATCHDPEHAFVDPRFSKAESDQAVFINGALSVGDDGFSLGGRNAPTAMYAMFSPTFDAKTIKGGQFHDGRSATLTDQAMGPPLDGAEMQMPNKASVVERIKENTKYISAFKNLYGENIFDDINASYEAMGEAIAKFEKTDEFAPFDSKYDRFLKCKETKGSTDCYVEGEWTVLEQLGESLFFSNNNTNCKTCHQLKGDGEQKETFSNYEYHNIGTPKNFKALQARVDTGNATDANATEHGVYGAYPEVGAEKDGAIRVPTLRNVAVTAPYMNNGIFQELKTVLEFYDHMGSGNRPNNPETGKPWGEVDVKATINLKDLEMKSLNDRKIEALEAFLNTLTDKKYEHLIK